MSKATKIMMTMTAGEINKQVQHLEEIQKEITDRSVNSPEELMKANADYHEIDTLIADLKFSLEGESKKEDPIKKSFSGPKKTRLVFKI